MRRVLCLGLALLLLCGCSASGSYVYSREHVASQADTAETEDINNRAELTDAISSMLQSAVQSDTLMISDYQGDLDAELEDITAELTESYPYGAYAVSSILCKQVSILSRTQLTVSVQYSRTAGEIYSVVQSPTADDLTLRITEALQNFSAGKAFYLDGVSVPDAEALVEKCWLQDPCAAVGLKSLSVARYPAAGDPCILELTAEYLDKPAALRTMSQDVRKAAAAVCSEFSGSADQEKLDFIYAYLRDRVVYDTDAHRVVSETGGRQPKTSLYTAYGALLENRAAQSGIILAAKALCDELQLPALVISGRLEEEPYLWLVVTVDGVPLHFDPTSRLAPEGEPAPEAGGAAQYVYTFTLTEGRLRFYWNKRLYGIY